MIKLTAPRLTIALALAILPKLYQKSKELSEIKILSILRIINKELDFRLKAELAYLHARIYSSNYLN